MRRKINRIADIERAAELARLDRIRRELATMPYREPTRAELLALKESLCISDEIFADLFGDS